MNPSDDEHRDDDVIDKLMRTVEERLDVEALAHAVEQRDYSYKMAEKLRSAFGDIREEIERIVNEMRFRIMRGQSMLATTQHEIRELILDVALLKRAASSVGQVGVLNRRQIERELVLELLPPSRPRDGAGVKVAVPNGELPRRVDCESRLHLCKAACCRIFDAHLTADEVESDRYDWDPKRPYALRRERVGCTHLRKGTCECAIYFDRPLTCRNYSCENDGRIWSDFANRILNPDLASRLASLDIVSIPTYVTGAASGPSGGFSNTAPTESALKPTGPSLGSPVPETGSPQTDPNPLGGETGQPARATVQPPNFDDLRNLVVPRPNKVFVAPHEATDGDQNSIN